MLARIYGKVRCRRRQGTTHLGEALVRLVPKTRMRDRRVQASNMRREYRPGRETTALSSTGVRLRAPVQLQPFTRRRSRGWLDWSLLIAECLAAIALIAGVGYTLADGPLRDWLYGSTPPAAALVQAETAPASQVRLTEATDQQPQAVVQQLDIAGETPATRARHPELGYALPSVETRWRRPVVAHDYLAPARDFVPATTRPPAPVEAAAPAPEPVVDLRPTRLHTSDGILDTGVVEVFLQDNIWQVADYAAGYLHGTGLPDEGNLVMAGHKGLRGAVFANLEALKTGDDIFVDTADRTFRYRVRETGNVWPSQVSIMFPTPTPTLTLLTCTNWDLQRFVVIADLVDSAPLQASVSG